MRHITLIAIGLLFTISIFAQSEQYVAAMESAISRMDTTEAIEDWKTVVNTFERIGQAEEEEWLPQYYQAYSHIRMAITHMQQQNMVECEINIEASQKALDKAKKLAGKNSEIVTLQGYIYQGRIWSNPQQNGPVYSPKASQAIQQAMQMEPGNPRPHHLMGQNLYFTPAQWGGGAKVALPHLKKADEAFENFEPKSSIHPSWGKVFNDWLLEQATAKLEEDK